MPVSGAPTTATNSAPMPTAARAASGGVNSGIVNSETLAEQQSCRGANDEQWREQATRKSRCIRQRPEDKAHREENRDA